MSGAPRWMPDPRAIPTLGALAVFVLMAAAGGMAFKGFFSQQVFLNLLIDNAFLLVVAVGMTFVILSGGIDLSVGAVVALASMVVAFLVQQLGWSLSAAFAAALCVGIAFGVVQGWLIARFNLQPFVVTLAGMFLARGSCYLISIDSIAISDEAFSEWAQMRVALGGENAPSVSIAALVAVAVLIVAMWVARATSFGRTIYAMGGSPASAVLMGLPVFAATVGVYTLSGLLSALGGVLLTFYMLSGYGLHAVGLELDAIAAVVIGGTLLSGGAGYVIGTLFGVLILGLIQTAISFEGSLSSWWTRITVGVLLLVSCLLQRLLQNTRR